MKAGSLRGEKINFDTQKIKYWKVKNCSHDGSFWKWFLFWKHSLYKKRDLCKRDGGYEASGSRPVFHLETAKVSFFGGGVLAYGGRTPLALSPPLLSQRDAFAIPRGSSLDHFFSNLLASILGHGGWGGVWKEGVVCFKAMSHFKVLVFLETDSFLLRFPERSFAKP